MRFRLLLSFLLIGVLIFACSDDKKTPTGTDPDPDPIDDTPTNITSFTFKKHGVFEELPNTVVATFQVVGPQGQGADFLTLDRFQVLEGEALVNPTSSAMYILKKDNIFYTAKVVLVLDKSSGADLAMIKKGATEFVNRMSSDQSIAIYAFDNTVTLVQDFTRDKNTLLQAITDISAGDDGRDIYGAIMQGVRSTPEEYTRDSAVQAYYVLITDGQDTKGTYQAEYVAQATRERRIQTIGVGSGVDTDILESLGHSGSYNPATEAELTQSSTLAQGVITSYAKSYYLLAYRTDKRGESAVPVEITITRNANTEKSSALEGTFNSTDFLSVDSGLYINWSLANPDGIDFVMVMVGKQRQVTALSTGGAKQPNFQWSVADNSILQIAGGSSGVATLVAQGADGDETTVTVKDVANGSEQTITVRIVSFLMGQILRELWENIPGTSINDLTSNTAYPDNPTLTEYLTSFEAPTGIGDDYGQRVRGFVHPQATGEYTFFISSDDVSSLYLSSDENPVNAVVICNVSSWTNAKEWTKETNQKSNPIQLEAGKAYYIEALHKEGGGGDNLTVGWNMGSGGVEVLGGDVISAWVGD